MVGGAVKVGWEEGAWRPKRLPKASPGSPKGRKPQNSHWHSSSLAQTSSTGAFLCLLAIPYNSRHSAGRASQVLTNHTFP